MTQWVINSTKDLELDKTLPHLGFLNKTKKSLLDDDNHVIAVSLNEKKNYHSSTAPQLSFTGDV